MNNTELQKSVWKDAPINHYWNVHGRTMWFFKEMQKYKFESIFEVGCNCGRHLYGIKDKIIGGIDINESAINFAKEKMPHGLFSVGAIQDMSLDKYDIVFSSGVLLHITPEDIEGVIGKMVDKATKYVMHMETNGNNRVINGPSFMKPSKKVCDTLFWVPNITEIYKKLGLRYDIIVNPYGERDAKHFIVVDLSVK